MALDDPTRGLMDMGLGLREARSLASLLRGSVAPFMSENLPDLEYSAALGVLIGARPGLLHFLPRATQVVLDLGTGSPDPALALASLYPVGYLQPVIYELLNRAKADPARDARFRAALSRSPAPSDFLQDFRVRYADFIPEGTAGAPPISAATTDLVGDQLRTAIGGIPDRSSHARAKEWTGWTLLAAMHGLDTYRDDIPVPSKRRVNPRNPASPERSYRAALVLLIGGALSLIAETED